MNLGHFANVGIEEKEKPGLKTSVLNMNDYNDGTERSMLGKEHSSSEILYLRSRCVIFVERASRYLDGMGQWEMS